MLVVTSSRLLNQCWLRHSSLNLPFRLSTKAFYAGFSGWIKANFTPVFYLPKEHSFAGKFSAVVTRNLIR